VSEPVRAAMLTTCGSIPARPAVGASGNKLFGIAAKRLPRNGGTASDSGHVRIDPHWLFTSCLQQSRC